MINARDQTLLFAHLKMVLLYREKKFIYNTSHINEKLIK